MKHKNTIASVAFLLLGLGGLHAQENTVTTGGESTGTGGTSSYTIGQIVYTTNTGTNGSTAQGMQQPYEISTTLGINDTSILLELSVYPNPTTDYLTLKVDDNSHLSFQLYDLQGRIIEKKKVNNNITNISLQGQPVATYFLSVIKNNQIVKTFKVIKL